MKRQIEGHVFTADGDPIVGAKVVVETKLEKLKTFSNDKGFYSFGSLMDPVKIWAHAVGACSDVTPIPKDCGAVDVKIDLKKFFNEPVLRRQKECGPPDPCDQPLAGSSYLIEIPANADLERVEILSAGGISGSNYSPLAAVVTSSLVGSQKLQVVLHGKPWTDSDLLPKAILSRMFSFGPPAKSPINAVALQRSAVRTVGEQDFWTLIRSNSRSIGFSNYARFIEQVLGLGQTPGTQYPTATRDARKLNRERQELTANYGVGAYELLRTATELFLLLNCRVATSRNLSTAELAEEVARRGSAGFNGNLTAIAQGMLGQNSYIQGVIEAAFPGEEVNRESFFADGILTGRTFEPCLMELIWSYWHEEGMLVQSVNALTRRFQNHTQSQRDPLAHFELDPLRPLNNILWGYTQEEYRRLTIPRRNLEYSHHYGLQLIGRAVGRARPADARSKFLESFHNLLQKCAQFFKEDNDTTVIADGFPLLNALKEVHLILAHGAHNQFGDLPWAARVEMLIQQWIMARSETRDFLQSRAMVPYTEAWMPQVDTMKTLQGWTDTGVSHFRDLATYGEQLLLSVRYGNWIDVNDEDAAKSWARYWRPEVQSYLHSYRAVTGVDLTNPDTVDATMPAVLMSRRWGTQLRSSR
jgi:hypothetical protein